MGKRWHGEHTAEAVALRISWGEVVVEFAPSPFYEWFLNTLTLREENLLISVNIWRKESYDYRLQLLHSLFLYPFHFLLGPSHCSVWEGKSICAMRCLLWWAWCPDTQQGCGRRLWRRNGQVRNPFQQSFVFYPSSKNIIKLMREGKSILNS